MSGVINSAKQWWSGLAVRERWIVAALAVSVSIVAVDSVVISPLLTHRQALRAGIDARQDDLVWMQKLAAQRQIMGPATANGSGVATGGASIVVVIDTSVRQHDLGSYVQQNQSSDANSARVSLKDAPFEKLVPWLNTLRERYGVRATQANIQSADAVGLVDARFTLQR